MIENTAIIFEHSPWWMLGGLLLGGLYAYLLYSTPNPWSKKVNWLLAIARGITVFLVFILLLEPKIKTVTNEYESPIAVVGVDNSESIAMSPAFDSAAVVQNISAVLTALKDKGYDVRLSDLDARPIALEALKFDGKKTALGEFINHTKTKTEGLNHPLTVLITDGLNTSGRSIETVNSSTPIYGLGLGDTAAVKDISVSNLRYNKIAYEGNTFTLLAEISNSGYDARQLRVRLTKGGELLQTKQVYFDRANQVKTVLFKIENQKEGNIRLTVKADILTDEVTVSNNQQNAYIDIIKGKQNILIAAKAPHPDVKFIKSVLDAKDNYTADLYIDAVDRKIDKTNYDLIICHQCFSRQNKRLDGLVADAKTKKIPIIHFLGTDFSIPKLTKALSFASFRRTRNQTDLVTASFNKNFEGFKFNSDLLDQLENVPPVTVPYGKWTISPKAQTLLFQRIGSVASTQPLWIVDQKNDYRQSLFIGEGLWLWRMHEKALDYETSAAATLMSKVIQFSSAKNDKRKLRVFTNKKEYFEDEKVVFTAELYNASYERIYDIPVDINIKGSDNKTSSYTFTPTLANPNFSLSNVVPDQYTYTASAEFGSRSEKSYGNFIVKVLALEGMNLQANHRVMRRLSDRTGGTFYDQKDVASLIDQLKTREDPSIIHSYDEYRLLIDHWIILLVIALIIASEWFFRKYLGKY